MTNIELKALRNKLGLSVTRASRQCDVSARTWQRWESGTQSIPEGAVKLFKMINKIDGH